MSDKAARTYTHASNRAKRQDFIEKKTVYKGVLDNPYRVQWPSVPINLQNAVLARLISLLDGVADYHHNRAAQNRKRKRDDSSNENLSSKKRNRDSCTKDIISDAADTTPVPQTPAVLSGPPSILQHVVYGINEVTKRLETQVHHVRRTVLFPTTTKLETHKPICRLRAVFVCRADVNPVILVNHFPHLIAAFNSAAVDSAVKLVPLPKGAEASLAQMLGIKRVTVLAIDDTYSKLPALLSMVEATPTLTAPWLTIPGQRAFISTHIKQLRTTAPKDIKLAKEKRIEGKILAKKRRKTHNST